MNQQNITVPPTNQQHDIFDFFRIQLDEGSAPDCVGVHQHDYHEIIYCRSNCGASFQIDGRNYPLQRGDMVLIPPQTPHAWLVRSQGGEPYMGYRLCMDTASIDRLSEILPKIQISHESYHHFVRTQGTVWEEMGEMFRALYEETHFRSVGWETAAMSSFTYLLTQACRAMLYSPGNQNQQEKHDLYEVILSYVQSHLSAKITLEDIAQRFWVSPSTITNLFNKNTGTSFYKYVMSLRLSEAKNLISEGMPMEKIALKVGFSDYSTFYRAFKKEYGISPRQYYQTATE